MARKKPTKGRPRAAVRKSRSTKAKPQPPAAATPGELDLNGLMEKHRFTQATLADAGGWGRSSIWRWATGRVAPRSSQVWELIDFFTKRGETEETVRAALRKTASYSAEQAKAAVE